MQHVDELFGPIRQVAYIVTDMDTAIETWHGQLGVGPFAVTRGVQPLRGSRYRGEPSGEVTLSIGFAYIGDVQLELILQLNDTPSMYKESIDRGHFGLHHYAFCVDDFDAAYGHAMANGFEAIVDAGAAGFARMSYVESKRVPGLVCELIEWNRVTRPYFDGIHALLEAADPSRLVHEFDLMELARRGARA